MRYSEKQLEKLISLLIYLKHNNVYWEEKLRKYNNEDINLYSIRNIYKEIQVVTKKEIINNLNRYLDKTFYNDILGIINENIGIERYLLDVAGLTKNHDRSIECDSGNKYYIEMTSGTTGKPFAIVKNASERFVGANYLLKCRRRHCKEATIQNGFLLAHEVDEYLKNINYLHEDFDMKEIVDYLISKKPKWMFVTANTLKRLMDAIINYGKEQEVKKIGIEFIEVTSAELLDDEKNMVEKIFGTNTRNQYGCREVWNIAYECPCGKLHVNNYNLIVDLVDIEGNIIDENNKIGEVVVTSLFNNITPFIKYYIGDYAYFSEEKCECGQDSPILVLCGGREIDKLKNTKYFGSAVFRKVLRVLFFKGFKYNRIKIIQDGEYHLSVYVEKCQEYEKFIEKFIEIASILIDNFDEFKIDFFNEYPFIEENRFLKEQTFECRI